MNSNLNNENSIINASLHKKCNIARRGVHDLFNKNKFFENKGYMRVLNERSKISTKIHSEIQELNEKVIYLEKEEASQYRSGTLGSSKARYSDKFEEDELDFIKKRFLSKVDGQKQYKLIIKDREPIQKMGEEKPLSHKNLIEKLN